MFYKIGKKIFHFLIDFLHFTQVSLIFLAFFTTFYWLLQIGKVGWVVNFAPIFEPIKSFVHLFYTRVVTVDEVTVDFAFLIGSFTMLLIVWGLKFVIESVEDLEKKFDAIHRELKDKSEKLFNMNLEMHYTGLEHQNKKFLVLVKFDMINLAKDSFFNRDTEVGIEEKQKITLEEFCQDLAKKVAFEKRVLEDKVLFYFNHFEDVDKVINEINKSIEALQLQLKNEKWQLSFCAAIEAYSNDKEIVDKCKTLMILVKLNLKNEIVCLATFNQRYQLIKHPEHFLEGKGIYKIHQQEDVFSVKNREKYIKHL